MSVSGAGTRGEGFAEETGGGPRRRSEHSSRRGADKTSALLWITGAQFTADTRAPVRS